MNSKNQINIFIVDDNTIFTLALKANIETTFKDLPIRMDVFETGERFMEKFRMEKPEVVILDYHLDGKYPDAADGIKVLEHIKKENPETNVIMLTNDDDMDIALKSFHLGAFDYVVKTETQFRKINFSLLNLFKILEAKSYAKRQKSIVVALCVFIALLIGVVIAAR